MANNRPTRQRKTPVKYTADPLREFLSDDGRDTLNVTLEDDSSDEFKEIDEEAEIDEDDDEGEPTSDEDEAVDVSRDPIQLDERSSAKKTGSPSRATLQLASRPTAGLASKFNSLARKDISDAKRNQGMFSNRESRYLSFFGKEEKDLIAAVRTRDKWSYTLTLPIREADRHGNGGYSQSFFSPHVSPLFDKAINWAWYIQEAGKEAGESRQSISLLKHGLRSDYFSDSEDSIVGVLLGPLEQQAEKSLNPGEYCDIGQFWPYQNGKSRDESAQIVKEKKQSWLFNAGGPVKSAQWIPHQTQGK
jgi:hypothetical protein